MSIQHAQQYIAALYEYDDPDYIGTLESGHARAYLDYKTGQKKRKPRYPTPGRPHIYKQIEQQIDKELLR